MRERVRVTLCCTEEEDKCQSEFEKDCDINVILSRIVRNGGEIPKDEAPVYADVSEIGDFVDTQMKLVEVKNMFDSLPDKVKERFNGNIQYLFDFMEQGRSDAELADALGLDVSALSHTNSPSKPSVLQPVDKADDGKDDDKSSDVEE